MSRQQLKEKGFTIIEVVLVLAIAALIFLMVFIALPALQRNQRDSARKQVVSKVASAVTTYQSNKRGAQPANGAALTGYVDGEDSGSDTKIDNEYTIKVTNPGVDGVGSAALDVVQVMTGTKCNDTADAAVKAGATSRNASVLIKLENGDAVFCQSV